MCKDSRHLRAASDAAVEVRGVTLSGFLPFLLAIKNYVMLMAYAYPTAPFWKPAPSGDAPWCIVKNFDTCFGGNGVGNHSILTFVTNR